MKKRKWLLAAFCFWCLFLISTVSASAASWKTAGDAHGGGSTYTLTDATVNKRGGLFYDRPLDTRNGFTD